MNGQGQPGARPEERNEAPATIKLRPRRCAIRRGMIGMGPQIGPSYYENPRKPRAPKGAPKTNETPATA